MGCDIHLYVEKRVEGQWVSADRWVPNEYAGEEGEEGMEVAYESRFYSGRNYDLFAILADVRNGKGFAGIKTGEGFVPIADPRGLPDDVSEQIKADSDRWGIDGHSHSWLTLGELLAYDWTQGTTKQGVVNGPQYFEWNRWRRGKGEGPDEYCGGVSGPDVEHVSEAELQQRIAEIEKEVDNSPSSDCYLPRYEAHERFRAVEERIFEKLGNMYAHVEWKALYYKQVRSFLSDTVPRLLRLAQAPEKGGTWLGLHDVRIVFWFDN